MNLDDHRKEAGFAFAEGRKGTVVTAIIVILVGVVLLLNQLGVLPPGFEFHFWPVVFVAFGLGQMLTSRQATNRLWGGLLVVVGIFLELNKLGVTHIGLKAIWPLLIIGLGVSLLWQALENKRSCVSAPSAMPRFSSVYVFSGTDRKITSKNFQGGKISAVFGGFKMDLTRADIEGDQAAIEVNAVFGGGEIIVPEVWRVAVEGGGIFGAFEDKTRHFQPDASQPVKTLIVKGSAIFGGIVVRN
jgi:predicted membrane protein